MPRPKFRYVRRHDRRDLEPAPGVGARAVLAMRLGAVLAVIIAITAMYLRSAMGLAVGEEATSLIVLVTFLLPSLVVLGRAWWDRRHPRDPYADLPAARDGGRRVLNMPRRPREFAERPDGSGTSPGEASDSDD
jgi:hypothetical protein